MGAKQNKTKNKEEYCMTHVNYTSYIKFTFQHTFFYVMSIATLAPNMAEFHCCNRSPMATKPKIFSVWPFTEKRFDDLSVRTLCSCEKCS